MPLPLTTPGRNALAAETIASAFLLELKTDEGTLRAWDKGHALTFETFSWEPMDSLWTITDALKSGADLVPEALTISFEGSEQYIDTSFVGRLLDRTWHQRKIRIRQLLFEPATNFITPIEVVYDWRGYMDTIDAPEGGRVVDVLVLNSESGMFGVHDSNVRTLTDQDQRLRDANDASFRNMALKINQDVPFGVGWSAIPGSSPVAAGGTAANSGATTGYGSKYGAGV